MSIQGKHFIVDPQPQDRANVHEQISNDPDWQTVLGDEHAENKLDAALGQSLAELHSSLALLTGLNLQARLLGKYAVRCLPYDAEPDTQFMVMSSTALQTGGLSDDNIHGTQERLADSLEEKPLRFNIVDPDLHDDDGEESVMARVNFDGTEYDLTRWGIPFDYPVSGSDRHVQAEAYDTWTVWDYNAEKRRQHIAERDGVVEYAQSKLSGVKSAADSSAVAEVLCTVGLLRDEHFLITPRHRGNDHKNDTDEELLAFRTSPEGQRSMHSYNELAATRTAEAYEPLEDKTKDIEDKTQLAFLRYWYATKVGVVGYFRDEDSSSKEERVQKINEIVEQKISQTEGAASWPLDKVHDYLRAVIAAEAKSNTEGFMKYYKGHDFQRASGGAGFQATTDYPELHQDKKVIKLEAVLAETEHAPSLVLTEEIRALERMSEDADNSDDNDYRARKAELRNAVISFEATHKDYFKLVDTAEEAYAAQLDFVKPKDKRHMIIEGILLARKLTAIVDAATYSNL